MENASKALLIAGAILIAILLIAIGMIVFTNANGIIGTATSNMSTQEKQAFNKQFTVYEGKQSGSVVKELISLIETNNSGTDNMKVTYDASGDVKDKNSEIYRQKQYDVKFFDTDGVVNKVKITISGKTGSGGGADDAGGGAGE